MARTTERDAIREATCTDCNVRDGHAPTCRVLGDGVEDAELRRLWRRWGGEFYGPNVETGAMPESRLLPLLRTLMLGEMPR